jgi:tetratricopeptide (TPR) repeat protein
MKWTRKRFRLVIGMLFVVASASAIGYVFVIPDSAGTIQLAEQSLVEQEDAVRAEKLVRKLLFFEPENGEALVLLGIALNRQERLEEAIQVFERVPGSSDSALDAAYGLSACQMLIGRYQDAESVLTSLIAEHPNYDAAREMLRRLLVKTFRSKDAERLILARFHRRPTQLNYLPECLKASVEFPFPLGTRSELAEFNDRYPGQPVLIAALALANRLLGDTSKADELFRESIELPDAPLINIARAAEFWTETGHWEMAQTAIDRTEQVLKNDDVPPDRAALVASVKASLHMHRGRYEEARDCLTTAISLCPDCPQYFSRRSVAHRRINDPQAAAQDTEQAMMLGECLAQLRELSKRIDRGELTPEICAEVSRYLSAQGHAEMSAAWKRFGAGLRRVSF